MSTLHARDVRRLFLAGAHALNENKEYINELNVFPVPDGDTGTNMTMTVVAASKELLSAPENDMEAICRAISGGALRGARGNSGVILSQLFRGFTKSIREKAEIGCADIAEAASKAVESAYRAVMKPKEGTILTVSKAIAGRAAELKNESDVGTLLTEVLEAGREMLAKTPDMLPVLKQAGVVDSGGQGLVVFLEGMQKAYAGEDVEMAVPVMKNGIEEGASVDVSSLKTSDIRFGYCTEFIIKSKDPFPETTETELRSYLETIGDSIVCVADENVVKIHVHTNDPGLAIQKALSYGELSKLKIDNMREEHEERLFKNAEKLAKEQKKAREKAADAFDKKTAKEVGFVTVCSGDGFAELFRQLGVDQIISGGQTMNPSTEDFLSAIRFVNARNVFVFPNNSNVILAADQAAKLEKSRRIIVVPTKEVTEGISCMLHYLPDRSVKENTAEMNEARKTIRTAEVTYSIRDTVFGDTELKKGDYMALSGKTILSSGEDLLKTAEEAAEKIVDGDTAVLTIYYGSDVTDVEAEELSTFLGERLSDVEVEVVYGGQPVYYYLICAE